VTAILATLTLFNFVAALQGYRASMNEAESLFDNQLVDIAQLVANLDLSTSIASLKLENDILFQIFDNNTLTMKSSNSPSLPLMNYASGFDYVNQGGYRWRTFSLSNNDRRVIVAERSDLRFVLAESVVLESIVPILLGIPLVGLIIWFIVSLGLLPLKSLSKELKHKQAQDLSPIGHENTTEELAQVIESTNGFITRLGDVLEREKRFSADAAHELRTPISVLKIQLHNLKDDIDGDNASLQQLQSGVDRMQHLIEQLLSLYRSTPEKLAENYQNLDLYHVAQEQIALAYADFEGKKQTLEMEGKSALIQADKFAVETLISNLLSNANKYTPIGGEVLVSIASDAQGATLTVEDSGIGIAPLERERIFDRFYRSYQASDIEQVPGCGLGLTIVAHIAKLHHAQIDIQDSRFDTGTAFTITFGAGS
jgi:two-component system sensor histidine kinase QseC